MVGLRFGSGLLLMSFWQKTLRTYFSLVLIILYVCATGPLRPSQSVPIVMVTGRGMLYVVTFPDRLQCEFVFCFCCLPATLHSKVLRWIIRPLDYTFCVDIGLLYMVSKALDGRIASEKCLTLRTVLRLIARMNGEIGSSVSNAIVWRQN